MSDTQFDYIIVGAGTAGCLLANRLSADARKRVLLIEAGRKDDYHWVHIPVGYLYCIGNPRTDWLYQTAPDAGLNGRSLRYPRGKVLGGCSSINGMIYMRGQARDYDQWASLTGDDTWRWDQCLPYFKLHEDHHAGANALHGAKGTPSDVLRDDATSYGETLRHHHAGGEWRIERQRLRWDVLDAFAEAAVQAGVPAMVMAAPMIPALNDHELEQILEKAAAAGATEAGYILLRLPLELRDLFREWLLEHYPGKLRHVMSLVQSTRSGKDYDARFGFRQTGEGTYAELMGKRFAVACQRLGLNRKRRSLRVDLFKRPVCEGGQMSLF